jgi:hypothetical protein
MSGPTAALLRTLMSAAFAVCAVLLHAYATATAAVACSNPL